METTELFTSYNTDIDTLLFDLDETLIHRKSKYWIEIRFLFKAMWLMRKIIPIWKFYSAFWKAVKKSKTHKTENTNHSIFLETLSEYSKNNSIEKIDSIIKNNLNNYFLKLKKYFTPVPGAKETLEIAHKLGYKIIIATNPSIPEVTVKHRLEWAEVSDIPFKYITHSEIMTRCKPDPDFYNELLSQLSLDNKQCLMIGNDLENDLVAQKAGILTFILKTDYENTESQSIPQGLQIEGSGTYTQLQEWLRCSAEKKLRSS